MTGFKLSWKIENEYPPLELMTAEVGTSFTTPGFGQHVDDVGFYKVDHNFNASLVFPSDLPEQIGNGILVVEMRMPGATENIGKEEFFFTEPRYVFIENYGTWSMAEKYCQMHGGNLASAESLDEVNNLVNIVNTNNGKMVWLGGKEEGGKWGWSDGRNMTHTEDWWTSTYGQPPYCSSMEGGLFYRQYCGHYGPQAICTLPHTSKIEDKTTFSQNYIRGEAASVSSINVAYRYQAFKGQQVNNPGSKTKAGFKIDWYIKDQSGSRVSSHQSKEQQHQFWKEVENDLVTQNEDFQKIVQLAATTLVGVPKDEIIAEAISRKTDLLKSNGLGNCQNEQVLDMDFGHFVDELTKDHPLTMENGNVSLQDIALGIPLYMIGKHCPKETMKLSQFLLQLADEESLPTIILAIVNTLQSLTPYHKLKLGRIYLVLDNIFGFHLDKILLATCTPDQLSALENQLYPFFNPNDKLIKRCLSGVDCRNVFVPIQGGG